MSNKQENLHFENNKKEFWRKLPNSIQKILVHTGLKTANFPTEWGDEFEIYNDSKRREMLNRSSISGQIQFIQLEIIEWEKEQDFDKKEQRSNMIGDLCFSAFHSNNKELSEKEKEQILNLRENFYKKRGEFYRYKSEQNRKKENEIIKEKLRAIIHTRKIELDNKIITIPGQTIQFLSGQLWYESGCRGESFTKRKGDWVEIGDSFLSELGTGFRNPLNGFLVENPSAFGESLWEMIPQKNYEIPDNVGDFIFGEFIDLVHKLLKKVKNQEKIPAILKAVEELKNCQLVEKKLDAEMELIFEDVKNES